MIRHVLPLGVVFGVLACSVPQAQPKTAAQLEVALTAAERLALAYASLPRCPVTDGTLCSKQVTIQDIQKADLLAYDAVQSVKKGTISPAAANDAITVLLSSIPK